MTMALLEKVKSACIVEHLKNGYIEQNISYDNGEVGKIDPFHVNLWQTYKMFASLSVSGFIIFHAYCHNCLAMFRTRHRVSRRIGTTYSEAQ